MSEHTVMVIPPDGDVSEVAWPKGAGEHLKVLYREIGCDCVCVVPVDRNDITVWADDEGMLVAEPEYNVRASVLCARHIVGTVVVSGGASPSGDTRPLGDSGRSYVERLLSAFAEED